MNLENASAGMPPFSPGYRASGLLLHIASLPSPYGIGDTGSAALQWVDRLQAAGQSWWQALPLEPPGAGDSPYQWSSSFAANPLLISPDSLIATGLLRESDCAGCSFPDSHIDYAAVIPFKHRLLQTAWDRFSAGACPDLELEFDQFRFEQSHWLDDYALFRALKTRFNNVHYLEWPAELIQRDPAALTAARRELAGKTDQVCFTQFLLFRDGRRLKDYAAAKGVRLIADLPFFASPDSSDVWAHPELFLLDADRRPRFVAGVPPDCHSSQGRRWGNPVFNWEVARQSGHRWFLDRLRTALVHVDVVRLEHFRGFAAAWHVPVGAPTAQCGQWVPGSGAALFHAVLEEFGSLPFIAEDLGMITADVRKLLEHIEAPGTRVLQLAFDGHSDNPHHPDNYVPNSVVYTGHHHGPTSRDWHERLPAISRQGLARCLRRKCEAADAAPSLIRLAWSCRAALAIAPLQDLLNLGKDQIDGNQYWRPTQESLQTHAFEWLRDVTRRTNRMAAAQPAPRRMEMAS